MFRSFRSHTDNDAKRNMEYIHLIYSTLQKLYLT